MFAMHIDASMAQGRLQTGMAGLTCTSVIGVITLALVLLQHHQPGPVVDSTMPTAPAVREQVDPTEFTPEELQTLQKRFGVHGPQPRLAQLFTSGMDQLQPLRMQTLERLAKLKPVILRESRQRRINPMLITAILFDEIQHSKPGEDLPFIAHSGLVKTHGPAQIGISELIHQKLLPLNPSPDDIAWARDQLLDPSANISLLAGKMQRLKTALGLSGDAMLQASASHHDAKALATLAYLHNGKLDYPTRLLRYMQDPELHQIIYGQLVPSDDILI